MPSKCDTDICEVCNEQKASTFPANFDGIHQNCPRCGEFKLSGSANSILRQGTGKEKRARLSGWVREQNQAGAIPMITSDNLNNILTRSLPSITERTIALLTEAERGLKNLGDRFNINDSRFLAATYSSNQSDVMYLLSFLKAQGLVEARLLNGDCEILPQGYIRLDEIRKHAPTSSQGFVAMSFHEDLNTIYSVGFEMGVLRAGYRSVRMDRVEHINRIDDEIIKQINLSRFVVADFTGHRGGVYFEAGYALGLGIPIFWTCRKSDMSELHFDIRQFNCIDWETPDELANRLSVRLEAVLGPGPDKK